MKKDRLYYQTDSGHNVMLETFVDNSLNLYVFNKYENTTGSWVRVSTESFMDLPSLNDRVKLEVKEADRTGHSQSGELNDDYKLVKLPKGQSYVEFLVKSFAQELLKDEAEKLCSENFKHRESLDFKHFLLNQVETLKESKVLGKSFDLESQAKVFLESTGMKLTYGYCGDLRFYGTKGKFTNKLVY